MADSKITGLTDLTTPADADKLVIVDVSDTSMAATGTTKDITRSNFLGAELDDIEERWTPASASTAAGLDFFEDTDNGSNKVTVKAPASIASNRTITFPDSDGELLTDQSFVSDGWFDAGSAWSYSAWDSGVKTATITTASDETGAIQLGDRIKFSQTTDGVKYGIVTKITTSAITAFMHDDYDFDNETITSPQYSHTKNPYGFDSNKEKWLVETVDTSNRTQASPTSGTWYNMGSLSLSVPIGAWNLSYGVNVIPLNSSAVNCQQYTTLSTSSSTESDSDFTTFTHYSGQTGTNQIGVYGYATKNISLTSSQTYYLNAKTGIASQTNMSFRGDLGSTRVTAVCNYL